MYDGEKCLALVRRAWQRRKAVIIRGVFTPPRDSREGGRELGGFYCLKRPSMTIWMLEIGIMPDSSVQNSNSAS